VAPVSGFYDAGTVRGIANTLFLGWGYDFYKSTNQLRADDQLIRAKVGQLLGFAQADLAAAETAYRHAHIAPPTRAAPFPDPAVVAGAKTLERLGREVGALIGRVAAAPAPPADRMTERYRDEGETLTYLRDHDRVLVGQAALLRSTVEGKDGPALLAAAGEIDEGLMALRRTLEARASALTSATR
jgi:hypothetical protein